MSQRQPGIVLVIKYLSYLLSHGTDTRGFWLIGVGDGGVHRHGD